MTETVREQFVVSSAPAVVPTPRGSQVPWIDRFLARMTRTGPTRASLRARNDAAAESFRAGRLEDAERGFSDTLAHCRTVLGEDHPDTLVAAGNLAAAHVAAGSPGRAVGLLERAAADRTRVWGATHPATLDARHGLGVALRDVGDVAAAADVLRGALADRARTLGPDHRDTVGTHDALVAIDTGARR